MSNEQSVVDEVAQIQRDHDDGTIKILVSLLAVVSAILGVVVLTTMSLQKCTEAASGGRGISCHHMATVEVVGDVLVCRCHREATP